MGATGLLVASCSVLYSPDGFDTPRPSGSEGGAVDAAPFDAATPPSADATRPDVDATPPAPNLAPSADLEGCPSGWGMFQAKLTPVDLGRTGGGCRVCAQNGSGTTFSIDGQTGNNGVAPGDVFDGEIWVRAAPGASAFEVFVTLRSQTDTYQQVERQESARTTLTQEWTKLTVTFRPTKSSSRMDMYVFTDNAKPGDCFIVDDARVEAR